MEKLLLTIDEAADLLSMGRATFIRDVLPTVRIVYVGRRGQRRIPLRELEAWVEREAVTLPRPAA